MAVWHLLPAFTHTQAGITEKKKTTSNGYSSTPHQKEKGGERGSSFVNEKHVRASALWPLPNTCRNPNRRSTATRIPPSVTAAFSPRAFKANIFWWRREWEARRENVEWRLGREIGRRGGRGVYSETRTTHMNTCLFVRREWKLKLSCSNLCSSLSPPPFFFIPPNGKINVKPRGTIVWTSSQELSLLSLPWH